MVNVPTVEELNAVDNKVSALELKVTALESKVQPVPQTVKDAMAIITAWVSSL